MCAGAREGQSHGGRKSWRDPKQENNRGRKAEAQRSGGGGWGSGEHLTSEQSGEAECVRLPLPLSSFLWSPPPGPLSISSCLAPELRRSLASSPRALGRPSSGLFTELLWSGLGSGESSVPEHSPGAGARSTRLGTAGYYGKGLGGGG